MKAITGVSPEEVRQGAKHILFVEGKDPEALDPQILEGLLERRISVRPMGPSQNIRAAAEALHPHHPSYYFLVDRDHQDEKTVEASWNNFPDAGTHNLLIWRRRELENYFLDPEYLLRSRHDPCKEKRLREVILNEARKRLFFDAANIVIIQLRERIKGTWIEQFEKMEGFDDASGALARLKARPEFGLKADAVRKNHMPERIEALFAETLDMLTGGSNGDIEFGRGRWLEMLKGKAMLPVVVNKCFRVRDASKSQLQGKAALKEVARGLVGEPEDSQPEDFKGLKRLVLGRLLGQGGPPPNPSGLI